jgi:hypothetical protein
MIVKVQELVHLLVTVKEIQDAESLFKTNNIYINK